VTLNSQQIPSHNHMLYAATAGDPTQHVAMPASSAQLAGSNPGNAYINTATPAVAFSPKAIGPAGQSQPHNNLQPLLTLNFCIALEGIFPSRG
jgi:microcystin-dependent protein